ncbi:MAG: glycosyltransferase family 2 protein [Flavobacteriaceae bacterium]
MATYNGEAFLKEQLDSILRQLSPQDELVISDDSSTDGTLKIIESYRDERIKTYHSAHKNVIFNFENALRRATGEIIFLSDQDDIWKGNKVQRTLEKLNECTLVFSNAYVFKGNDLNEDVLLYERRDVVGFFRNLYKNNYIGATMAFKAELLQVALPFPKQLPMHDIWLGLLAEITGKTDYIPEPLIYYRRHSNNVSTTGRKSRNSILGKIRNRAIISILLVERVLKKRKGFLC